MKSLIELACFGMKDDTPEIVRNAMFRMRDRLNAPNKPSMTQEEFDALPHVEKCILTCNMPGCPNMVGTHGMLCVEHKKESDAQFRV